MKRMLVLSFRRERTLDTLRFSFRASSASRIVPNRASSQSTDPTGKPALPVEPPAVTPQPPAPTTASGLTWTGEIPPQKWMNFYTKVLSKFASACGLKLTLKVEATPEGGVSKQKLDETKSALRELGLNDDVSMK